MNYPALAFWTGASLLFLCVVFARWKPRFPLNLASGSFDRPD